MRNQCLANKCNMLKRNNFESFIEACYIFSFSLLFSFKPYNYFLNIGFGPIKTESIAGAISSLHLLTLLPAGQLCCQKLVIDEFKCDV